MPLRPMPQANSQIATDERAPEAPFNAASVIWLFSACFALNEPPCGSPGFTDRLDTRVQVSTAAIARTSYTTLMLLLERCRHADISIGKDLPRWFNL